MTRMKELLARISGIGFALVMTLALSAGPLLAECQNQDGSERECTVSENATECLDNANDAHAQCLGDASDRWARGSCHIGRGIDGVACAAGVIGDTLGELLSIF